MGRVTRVRVTTTPANLRELAGVADAHDYQVWKGRIQNQGQYLSGAMRQLS